MAMSSLVHSQPAVLSRAAAYCRPQGVECPRLQRCCKSTVQAIRGQRLKVSVAAPVVDIPADAEVSGAEPATSALASPSFEFACPICLTHRFSVASQPSRSVGLSCPRCRRTFTSTPDYLDLTLTSGLRPGGFQQRQWGGTELFRSPVISWVYERGWRQGFQWAGFPGADTEYDMAMKYLQPAAGKVLVDMSCGSGLFTRRFARSGTFTGVVAADFSESMLQQAKTFLQEDGTQGGAANCPVVLLRADVGRLPFETGSVAAVHAGAAIHCWPNPQAALAEISRVLAPGGVFVGTTFMVPSAPLGAVLGDDLVRPLNQFSDSQLVGSQYRWWEEKELRDLCNSVGLEDFQRDRQWRFIMFAARKPALA